MEFHMFEGTVLRILKGEHDFDNHAMKVYLSNTKPNVTTDVDKSDLAEITNENGYSPVDAQTYVYAQTGFEYMPRIQAVDFIITASGGTVGPFRYLVLYDDDHSTDGLIGYWDRGHALILQDGESLEVTFGTFIFKMNQIWAF
jgi:hypothetical protein